jgi:hypothetical protein
MRIFDFTISKSDCAIILLCVYNLLFLNRWPHFADLTASHVTSLKIYTFSSLFPRRHDRTPELPSTSTHVTRPDFLLHVCSILNMGNHVQTSRTYPTFNFKSLTADYESINAAIVSAGRQLCSLSSLPPFPLQFA